MSEKRYDWDAAVLGDHSRKKHEILGEYFRRYLLERCKHPHRRAFRFVIVDAFSGAGQYEDGSPGSSLIFANTVFETQKAINLDRAPKGLPAVDFSCLMIINDSDRDALRDLEDRLAPFQAGLSPGVKFELLPFPGEFEAVADAILSTIRSRKFANVLFNLDQYGYTDVTVATLRRLMASARSVEIFLTYAVETLLTYLSRNDPATMMKRLRHIGIGSTDLDSIDVWSSKKEWLGAVERLVFDQFRQCAPFVSPFSINNPEGWRYWLMHFACRHRARQVYNDVLHAKSRSQAHCGRAGLNMLGHDSAHEGQLLLFDADAREAARNELPDDIPRLLAEKRESIAVGEFLRDIYNQTSAHSDDINLSIMASAEVEVLTPNGKPRRKSHTINATDSLRFRQQRPFYFMSDPIPPRR